MKNQSKSPQKRKSQVKGESAHSLTEKNDESDLRAQTEIVHMMSEDESEAVNCGGYRNDFNTQPKLTQFYKSEISQKNSESNRKQMNGDLDDLNVPKKN
jgi:hypothetical protein